MDNQNEFLTTIRRSLDIPPHIVRPKDFFTSFFPQIDTTSSLQTINGRTTEQLDELVKILQINAQALGIKTYDVRSHNEAAAVVVDLVHTKNPEFSDTKHIMQHDHPDLNKLQLDKHFSQEGVAVHVSFSSDRQLRQKTIASFIGITAPAIGVADSATLIQLTEPGAPRSTSLVPSIHIAFLKREHLVADMAEAYALLQKQDLPNSFVFITGPSKTADIEAQMVYGAHGPREVHLLIFSPQTTEKMMRPADTEQEDFESQEKE